MHCGSIINYLNKILVYSYTILIVCLKKEILPQFLGGSLLSLLLRLKIWIRTTMLQSLGQ